MDTDEDISAIYINLINMVDAFTNLQMEFIFLYETIARKKRYRNILILQANDKYKVVIRKPVVSERSPNLFLYSFTPTFVLIN